MFQSLSFRLHINIISFSHSSQHRSSWILVLWVDCSIVYVSLTIFNCHLVSVILFCTVSLWWLFSPKLLTGFSTNISLPLTLYFLTYWQNIVLYMISVYHSPEFWLKPNKHFPKTVQFQDTAKRHFNSLHLVSHMSNMVELQTNICS